MQSATEQRPLTVYLALGLLQGLTLWMASELWPHGTVLRSLCSALIVVVVVGGWQLQMLWGQLREAERWKLLLPAILLPAALAAWLATQFDQPRWYHFDETTGTLLLWSQLALAYILTPFIQAREPAHRWRFDYSALYRHAWNNGLLLFMSLVMLGVFWLLIWLWAGLFSMLGVDHFKRLFDSSGFVWMASATVIAAGLRIGLERGQVIDALRNVLQAMCRFLLPLTVVILLLFVVFLPFTGLAPLWATRHATPILLALVFAHVALLNGVVQDGLQAAHYPKPLRLLADASSLCLPLLAGLAMHALWLRIDQYGLTPDRVLAALLALLALAHGLALVRAVLRRDDAWLGGLRQSNPPLALFAASLLVLMHVPALSPLQMSAANQYERLLDTKLPIERTDLGALRFQLGEPGRDYLQALREQLAQPWADEVRRSGLQESLQRLDRVNDYWAWKGEQDIVEMPPIPWIGEPLPDADGSLGRAIGLQRCEDENCALLAVDLNADGEPEALLVSDARPRAVSVFGRRDNEGWRYVGYLRVPDGAFDGATLIDRLGRGGLQVVPPAFQALQIDGIRLEPAITD